MAILHRPQSRRRLDRGRRRAPHTPRDPRRRETMDEEIVLAHTIRAGTSAQLARVIRMCEDTLHERDVAVNESRSAKARRHLDDFFTEYDDHHDVMKARGKKKSARYKALQKLTNKPDSKCSERERKLKELTGIRTHEDHLDDFFTEYNDHHDFMRARGAAGGERHKALQKLTYKSDAECSERELKLKELLAVLNVQEREAYNRRRDERYRRDAIVVELQELRRDFNSLMSRRNYSFHLGCACLAVLVLLRFK